MKSGLLPGYLGGHWNVCHERAKGTCFCEADMMSLSVYVGWGGASGSVIHPLVPSSWHRFQYLAFVVNIHSKAVRQPSHCWQILVTDILLPHKLINYCRGDVLTLHRLLKPMNTLNDLLVNSVFLLIPYVWRSGLDSWKLTLKQNSL